MTTRVWLWSPQVVCKAPQCIIVLPPVEAAGTCAAFVVREATTAEVVL